MMWFIKLQHSDSTLCGCRYQVLQIQTETHNQLKRHNNGVKFMIICTFSQLGELMTDQVTGNVFSPYTWYIQFIFVGQSGMCSMSKQSLQVSVFVH